MKSTAEIVPLEREFIPDLKDLPPPEWNHDIVEFMNRYLGTEPFHAVVARAGDKIIGVGNILITGRRSWLGNIIVHPDFRRRSIGTRITRILMDHAALSRCDTINLMATMIGQKLYRTLGFKKATTYLFYRGGQTPPPGKNADIRPICGEDLDELFTMDLAVTGEDRRFMLEGHVDTGYVIRHAGTIRGFYLPDMGNGMIIANDPGAGLDLLRLKHSSGDRSSVFPEENRAASKLLLSCGFTEYDRSARMCLGKKYSWKPEGVYCRIAGYIG